MTTRPIQDVLAQIHAEAEAADTELRFVRTCREGDEIRQGDIYLHPLRGEPEHAPTSAGTLQLAEGDSAGSRHIVVGDATVHDRSVRSRDALDGPYLYARARVVLTHPEHAHISLPAGWYEIRYQRDFTAPLRRRVVD